MDAKFQVQLKIRKPVAEVFDAVVDGDRITGYFVKSSSGPLVEGARVTWRFAEVPEPVDVLVKDVIRNERLVFDWSSPGADATRVEMTFKPLDDGSTMVLIGEGGWPDTPAGIANSYDNAGGWMHMMCCLKALLEYDVHLREGGAF